MTNRYSPIFLPPFSYLLLTGDAMYRELAFGAAPVAGSLPSESWP